MDEESGMIDSLLQEREALRSQNAKQNAEHKRIVERLRAELDDTINRSGEENVALRKQLDDTNKSNQDLIRQLEVQTQQQLQTKNSLDDVERRYNVISTQKNNVVVLLGTAEATIASLREELVKEKDRSQDLSAQVSQAEISTRSQHAQLGVLKISEQSLRKELEEKQKFFSTIHSQLREKDQAISKARQEGDARVQEIEKECTVFREEAYGERRNVIVLQEQLRQEQLLVVNLQAKSEEVSALKHLHATILHTTTESHDALTAMLRETISTLKARVEQLESEEKVRTDGSENYAQRYQALIDENQERVDELNATLEEKSDQIAQNEKELSSLRELLSTVRMDPSTPVPPNLRTIMDQGSFSVPELYHQYCLVVEKCDETQARLEALQNRLGQREEEFEEYLEEKRQLEVSVDRWQRVLAETETRTETQENLNRNLQRANDELRKNLKILDRENKKLTTRTNILQADLAQALRAEEDFDEDQRAFKNPADLIEINFTLRETVEELSLERNSLKERLEAEEQIKDTFYESADAIRKINDDKSQLDRRMTELGREIQLYRTSTEDMLFKTFLQELSKNEQMIDNIQAIAQDQRAIWSLISVHNGGQISDHFEGLKRQVDIYRNEMNEWKNECGNLRGRIEQLNSESGREIKQSLEERGRLSGELASANLQLGELRMQLKLKSEEVQKYFATVQELHEKVAAAQQQSSLSNQTLESEKLKYSYAEEQLQNVKLDLSSVKTQWDSLRQQNELLQKQVQDGSSSLMQLQMQESRLRRELQDAKNPTSQRQLLMDDVVSREELVVEQQKHKVTLQALTEAKEQLAARQSSIAALPVYPSTPSTSHPRVNPEITLSMLRQSSVHQEELSQKIADLQSQLEKSKGDVESKNEEIGRLKQESTSKAREISSDNAALMKDLKLMKEERERQQNLEKELRTSLGNLRNEHSRIEELFRSQRSELDVLSAKHAAELKSHHAVVTQLEEVRKDAEVVKQNVAVSKRREADAVKALEDLRKTVEVNEKNLREEILLLEAERENAKNWKRTLYERVRPGSTEELPEDVQDMNILVEFQRNEIEKIGQQLQLAKDQGFSSAARIKSLQEQVKSLELDLQAALQRQRSNSVQSSWSETHAQQKAILNDSLELNARISGELTEARTKIDELQASLKSVQQTVEPLNVRIKELEREKIQLDQECATLKGELESWNNRFGVQQQKTEIDTLKRTIAEQGKRLSEQAAEYQKNMDANKQKLREKMKEIIEKKTKEMDEDKSAAVAGKETEITALRAQLASSTSLLDKVTAEFHASKKDVEVLQKSLSVLEGLKVTLSEELTTLREEMRVIRTRGSSDENNTTTIFTEGLVEAVPPPVTSVQPQPRVASVISSPRSTAVVTPQTQTSAPVQRSPVGRAPVAAVAPQSMERSSSENVAGGFVDAGEGPSGSGGSGIVEAPRRRAAVEEEDGGPANRKRIKPTLGQHPLTKQVHLRPPSPTSSDVTSSTSAPVALALAPAQPAPSTSSMAPSSTLPVQRARTASRPQIQLGDEQTAEVQPEELAIPHQESVASIGEERAVDSSAANHHNNEAAVGSGENAEGGMEVEEPFVNEGAAEEGMDADESGQLIEDQGGAGVTGDEWQDVEEGYEGLNASSEAETADTDELANQEGLESEPLQSATVSADGASGEMVESEDTPSPMENINQEATVEREAEFQPVATIPVSTKDSEPALIDLPHGEAKSLETFDILDDLVGGEEGELFDLASYGGANDEPEKVPDTERGAETSIPASSSQPVATPIPLAHQIRPSTDLQRKVATQQQARRTAAAWGAANPSTTSSQLPRGSSPQRQPIRKPISPPRDSASGESSSAVPGGQAPRILRSSLPGLLRGQLPARGLARGRGGRAPNRGNFK